MEQAIFAAGRSEDLQRNIDQIPGVVQSAVGYTGGITENPTYEDVTSQQTGHAEAVWVEYDTSKLTYETLVRQFFDFHDPTQLDRQEQNVGKQYRSAIFYTTDEQKEIAERVCDEVQAGVPAKIVTEITMAGPFYRTSAF
jgi:methionine-S-sulfoxide reductase